MAKSKEPRPPTEGALPASEEVMGEIEVLIRARYPLIYMITWEESRALTEARRAAERVGKRVVVWSFTKGFEDITEDRPKAVGNAMDPDSALRHVASAPDPTLFVLKDFHRFLDDPRVARRLRDLAQDLPAGVKNVAIVSPVLRLPEELVKEVVVVDLPLPGITDLSKVFDRFVGAVRARGDVRVDVTAAERDRLLRAAQGLTLTELEGALSKSVVCRRAIESGTISDLIEEKKQIVRKTGVLEYFAAEESLETVGGLDLLKEWLRKRADAFGERARRFGLPAPRGLLLVGVQGCGKSLTAKAVASAWRLPLLRLDLGRVFSGIVGSSEHRMREAIRVAESVSPCILWIDEIEKAMAGSGSSNFTDAGTASRVFATFTTWLQEKKEAVFVIATANEVRALPPELVRKGRFDEVFYVDLPNREEREEIVRIHLRKRSRNPDEFDVPSIAAETDGFSGSEIEQVIISAMYDAFERSVPLSTAHVIKNVSETVPLSRMMSDRVEMLRAWARERARPATSNPSELF